MSEAEGVRLREPLVWALEGALDLDLLAATEERCVVERERIEVL